MSNTIKIPYSEDINKLFEKGLFYSKSYDGKFRGDVKNGQFDFKSPVGTFVGTYTVTNKVIEITLTKKPILIPMSIIETFLKKNIK